MTKQTSFVIPAIKQSKRVDWLTDYCPVWKAPIGKYLGGTVAVIDIHAQDEANKRMDRFLGKYKFNV